MYKIIDTHCHIDMEQFDKDRDEVIKRSSENGVKAILVPATVVEDFEKEKELSEKYEPIYYMVGIHPHDAKTTNQKTYDEAVKHLNNEKCVGVGEIGLDYYYEHSPKDIQRDVFANFVELAIEKNYPVSIHCRDADDDLVDILISRKDVKGVIHCFSGSEKLLKLGLDLGLYFGIGGVLTFKNSHLKDVIKDVPLEFVVFETDAPFLAPVPKRGKRNEPLYIAYVIEKMAEILDLDAEKIAEIGFENAKRVFSLERI
ncbi:TatD family hydrolase [Hippea alviniae]|uniref:TatD family hydrolase n=1 Tax=Hippea alviniae TaxID=1279027 RepID=UPI0003B52EFC|nr:TatD family hydrolase [Hippea alviniae]